MVSEVCLGSRVGKAPEVPPLFSPLTRVDTPAAADGASFTDASHNSQLSSGLELKSCPEARKSLSSTAFTVYYL